MGNAASAGPEAAEDTTTGGGQRNEVTSVPDLVVAGDGYDDDLPKRPTPLEALVLVPRQSEDNGGCAGDDSDPVAAAAAARKAAEVARATTNVWHMQPPGAMSAGDDDVAKEHPYLIEAEPAPSRARVSSAQGKEEGGTTVGSAEIRSKSGNKLPPDAVKALLEPRLVTPDAASSGDMKPRKGGDGDEANESNNGAAIGSMADAKEKDTDVVEEVVAAATNDTTVDAAPNAEKR
jgi:hypothetical protein